jgi:hypothetical protein
VFLRTLSYVTRVLRSGIYVLILGGEVKLYVPFTAGSEFRNDWGPQLSVTVRPKGLEDPSTWWANASILCTRPTADVWGASFVAAYRHLLQESCAGIDFFEGILNKRDHPCVRVDGTHPWHHVWSETPPLSVEGPMLPFLSSYTGPDFADTTIPLTFPDWEIGTRLVFPGDRHRWPPRLPASVPWARKRNVLFFRGSNTGDGVREALCALHGKVFDGVRVDARITRASRRFRVSRGVVSTAPECSGGLLGKYVPMHVQSQFRYLVVVDGHSAPNRVGTLLLTGSLVFRVEGHTAGRRVWLDDFLRPMEHYVPVACDLSDLGQKISWAVAHPDECRAMADRALALGRRLLSRDAIVAYTNKALRKSISAQCPPPTAA